MENTLFVLVPDHQGAYPYPIENPLDGQTIPLILIGGAIKQPLVVDTYASQIDIAATLLAQLGLPHDEFTFSKNIMNPASPHFAYFTRPNYFGMITAIINWYITSMPILCNWTKVLPKGPTWKKEKRSCRSSTTTWRNARK